MFNKFSLYTSFDFVPVVFPLSATKNSIVQIRHTGSIRGKTRHSVFPSTISRSLPAGGFTGALVDSSGMDLWMFTSLEMLLVISTNACALHTLRSTLSIDASISPIEQSGPGILAESYLSLIVVTITNIIFNPVTYCSFRRYPLLGSASFGLKAVWCRHHQQGRSRWHCNPHIRCSISDQNRRAQ